MDQGLMRKQRKCSRKSKPQPSIKGLDICLQLVINAKVYLCHSSSPIFERHYTTLSLTISICILYFAISYCDLLSLSCTGSAHPSTASAVASLPTPPATRRRSPSCWQCCHERCRAERFALRGEASLDVRCGKFVALMRRVEAGVHAGMSYCINRAVSISSSPRADPSPRVRFSS